MNSDAAFARMAAAGYLTPGERDGCRTCSHGRLVVSSTYTKHVRCEVLQASTSAGGICPKHSPKVVAMPARQRASQWGGL